MTIEIAGFPRVLEFQRKWPDVEVEKFLWLHAGCEVETKNETVNSSDKEFFICSIHNVRSASRDALEV
jgi:hypothetical protein